MGRTALEFSYKARRAFRHKIYIIAGFVLLLLVLATLLFRYLIFPVVAKSDSMYPRIQENSFVLVSPVASFNRGDSVAVESKVSQPLNVLQKAVNSFVAFFTFQQYSPFKNSNVFTENTTLRRVVGIPGDTIYMKDYVLYIKPADSQHFLTEFELSDKSYEICIDDVPENWDITLGACGTMPEMKLDDDEYFLLCDNRTSGIDSRLWGSVLKENIVGRVLIQYFPFSRFGLM